MYLLSRARDADGPRPVCYVTVTVEARWLRWWVGQGQRHDASMLIGRLVRARVGDAFG